MDMNAAEALQQIEQFEAHYNYDGTYIHELFEHSPDGFAKFSDFLPLARHREKLDANDYWVAKLAAMQVADCGECLQLNVRMALEAGVPKDLVHATLGGGEALPEDLKPVYRYATRVAGNEQVDDELMAWMESNYGKGGLLEFGIAIATAKVFPIIKRAVGYAKSCRLIKIEI
jgi:alkylhydroperoxidase/carboxymuconolactone decarboxylase family protein YurZ